ncbi:MAG: hypothetical protein ACRED9_02605 [Caulobacteraceae bacterium]
MRINGSAAIFGAALMAGAALFACTPPQPPVHAKAALKVIGQLDCPTRQGDLNLKSSSADGSACSYVDGAGSSVAFSLVKLNGADAASVLAPLEATLKSELPEPAPRPSSSPGNGQTEINLPGIHIQAGDNGAANVAVGGVKVDASDNGDAQIAARGVHINANDAGAEIRVNEAGSGVRSTFLLVSDKPGPGGLKCVGYEARGPSSGPLVVAQMQCRGEDHGDLDRAIKQILKKNVGS